MYSLYYPCVVASIVTLRSLAACLMAVFSFCRSLFGLCDSIAWMWRGISFGTRSFSGVYCALKYDIHAVVYCRVASGSRCMYADGY